jgi:2-oxoglutarate decarboxylase
MHELHPRPARLLRRDLPLAARPLPAAALGLRRLGSPRLELSKGARVVQLINAYRSWGHLMADIDPLEYEQRSAPGPRARGPRPDHLGPRPRVPGRRSSAATEGDDDAARGARQLRGAYCQPRRRRVHAHPGAEKRRWIESYFEEPANKLDARGAPAHPRQAERGRDLRDLPADEVRRPEALLPRGRRVHHRAARRDLRQAANDGPRRGVRSACRTAAGSTCWPTSSARATARSSASSRAAIDPRSMGTGDVKYHLGAEGEFTSLPTATVKDLGGRQPVHLEAVNPVVEGIARAKMDATGNGGPPSCPSCCTATPRSPARASCTRRCR